MNAVTRIVLATAATALLAAAPLSPALADDEIKLTISDKGFEPATLDIPAGKKVKLTVANTTKKAAEFESDEIGREKVVPAGKTVSISVGPLKAGSYTFIDDFNKAHKGTINVK